MKHDYSNLAYRQALLRLFKPGSGAMPPLLAGRADELDALVGYLDNLQAETDPAGRLLDRIPHDITLYGPRGNGKTVLLESFARRCRGAGVHLVELRPKLTGTSADMAGLLLYDDDDAMAELLEMARPDAVRLGIPDIAGASWKRLPQAEKDALRVRHLEGLLRERCRKAPLVVAVDEAHTLDLDLGAALLNLSEALRKQGVPILLVLSGTPDLEGHLGKMDATFWDRAQVLPIGRLSEEATRDALQTPLAGKSIDFEPAALEEVVADSQRYPYFIQLWGRSLCQVLVKARRGAAVTPYVVAQAAPVVATGRKRYYGKRYQEMKQRGLLPAADVLAAAFDGWDTLHEDVLLDQLADGLDVEGAATQSLLDELSNLGYLWRPEGSEDCEPGIPSLMTHVRQALRVGREALETAGENRH